MKPESFDSRLRADLIALAAAAQGHSVPPPVDTTREARIAELKAEFDAGTLTVDTAALASKLVDAQLKKKLR